MVRRFAPRAADGDTALGWDLSQENSGREWIELRFGTPVYVSGFELYEVYNPGAVSRVSTTRSYDDDNTVACCGADAAPATPACASLPHCTHNTAWDAIWAGTPRPSSVQASTIFNPSVCPGMPPTRRARIRRD
jgi:hypothetical protein